MPIPFLRSDAMEEGDDFQVRLFSDLHIGSKLFNEEAFISFLEGLDEECVAIGLGDIVEGHATTHKYYDQEATFAGLEKPGVQFARFVELVQGAEAAEHILALQQGNHDWIYDRVHNFTRDTVCQELQVPYLGTLGIVDVGGVRFTVKHVVNKAYSMAKSPEQRVANMRAMVKRRGEDLDWTAHVVAAGHVHQLIVAPPIRSRSVFAGPEGFKTLSHDGIRMSTDDGTELVPVWAKWVALAGTFRDSGRVMDITGTLGEDVWTDYGEQKGMPPMPTGFPEFDVEDGKVVAGRTYQWRSGEWFVNEIRP